MRTIQNTTKSDSDSFIDGETGDTDSLAGWDAEFNDAPKQNKNTNYKIVKLANKKVSLINYLEKIVKLQFEITNSASGWSHKTCCPFKDHQDDSPSFFCNTIDNCFKCWGCHRGGGIVHFISAYYKRNLIDVAEEILSRYGDIDEIYDELDEQSTESSDMILLEFSDYIQKFIKRHRNNDQAQKFAESVMWTLDVYVEKHSAERSIMSTENLQERISLLKNKLENYGQ